MTDRPRMAHLSHEARCTSDVWRAFHRAPATSALTDGGQPESGSTEQPQTRGRRRETAPEGTMKDVSHTPVHGTGANRVWDRGQGPPGSSEKGVPDRDAELTEERVSARDDEHEPR